MPNPRQDSAHDAAVRQLARLHARQGWDVSAALPDYPSPRRVGRRAPVIPDIEARKAGAIRLIEVETSSTVNSQHARRQAATLRQSAAVRNRVTFHQVVVEEA